MEGVEHDLRGLLCSVSDTEHIDVEACIYAVRVVYRGAYFHNFSVFCVVNKYKTSLSVERN